MYKRIQFVMFDLKYLLGMIPDPWTDAMRKGFLQGFTKIVEMLSVMQNIDPLVKKEGIHLEYEQDWEGSFNLTIKWGPLVQHFREWCISDKIVLVKSLR